MPKARLEGAMGSLSWDRMQQLAHGRELELDDL